jgi:hypothetical protein
MTQTKSKTFILPAGHYFVGDTSYYLKDEAYDQVIKQFLDDCVEDGTYTTPGGQKMYISETKYGDGIYEDQDGDHYCVDGGNIGAVPIESPDSIELKDFGINPFLGGLVHWDSSFECSYDEETGVINIGGLVIDTDPEYDEDEDEEDWQDTLLRVSRQSEDSGIPFDHLMGMELGGIDH